MKLRAKAAVQSVILLVVSLVIALGLSEGMARVYVWLNNSEVAAQKSSADESALYKKYFNIVTAAGVRRLEEPVADRYLPRIPLAKGVDPKWFKELPFAPDRDPKDVDPHDAALQAEYLKRGHFGPEASYVWNAKFVDGKVCDSADHLFKNLPEAIKVFQPADGSQYPRYRYPASRTLASGMKTNRYGFRGSDFPADRSPDKIRIAFIGSSQTVTSHHLPFSYPEYFGMWLDKWLESQGSPLRTEIINAGREGIGTTDVAAILKQEVLPLKPDYVIFFDGANQMQNAQSLITSSAGAQAQAPTQSAPSGLWPAKWKEYSQLARVSDDAWRIYVAPALETWDRPSYRFAFPAGVDEANPNWQDPNLPLGLPVFLRDVNTMRELTRAANVPFAVSTLVWLDGSELSVATDPDQLTIANQLRPIFWPLKPPDIRRLIDFADRSITNFAKSHDVPLLDVASQFPRDPKLFLDGYHLNPEGLKLLGWIDLQQFVPILERDLRNGRLPIKAPISINLPASPVEEIVPHCGPSHEEEAAALSASLADTKLAGDNMTIKVTPTGVELHSAPLRWAYIAKTPLDVDCNAGGGWLAVDVRLAKGTLGIGVLNKAGTDFVGRSAVSAGEGVQTVYIPVESFAATGDFIAENWQDDVSADGTILAVRVAAKGGAPVKKCESEQDRIARMPSHTVSLAQSTDRSEQSSLHAEGDGVAFQSKAVAWAYIAQIPLNAECLKGGGWIAADVRVTSGTVGFGVLNRQGTDFLTREHVAPAPNVQTIYLPVDSFAAAGNFVVQNWEHPEAAGGTLLGVRITGTQVEPDATCSRDATKSGDSHRL